MDDYVVKEEVHMDVEEILFQKSHCYSGTLLDVSERTNNLIALYGADACIEIEHDYDSTKVVLSWLRKPTDAERKEKELRTKKLAKIAATKNKNKEIKELKEFKRLQAKYGSK